MKSRTKKLIGTAAVSGLILAAGAAVYAHGGSGYGPGMKWGGQHGMMGGYGGMHGFGSSGFMRGGDPVAYTDEQLVDLKANLGITADQEDAWNTYTEAVRGKAQLMVAHRQIMHSSGGPPLNMEQRIDLMQQGAEQMQRLATATADFYATLSPEQKSKANELIGRQFGHAPRFGGGPREAK